MWSVVHFKSNQSKVLLFKMIASFIFVFIVPSLTTATFGSDKFVDSNRDKEANYCLLPPIPEHGKYTVGNNLSTTTGDSHQYVKLDVTCDIGYLNNNTITSIFCINGEWSSTMPICVPDSAFCTLNNDLRVEYRCLSVPGSLERSLERPSLVPSGTLVMPICRSPAYFSVRTLSEMHCKNGIWDYNPICKPACGLVTQHRKLEGSSTNHLELPWHAVIYEKKTERYYHICTGSLITASKIISSASCFTKIDGQHLLASSYLVAVNKMYSEYNDPRDVNSQESAVVDIKIPSNYRSNATNFENDIAIVVVETSFIFHLSVRPVCLDFDNNLDKSQLTDGNYGKAVHWSYIENSAQSSFVLNVIDLQLPTDHQFHLSYDQFYAARNVSRIHSHRDRGGGLAVLEPTTQRYYLRGVGFIFFQRKNFEDLYQFTSIVKHEYFIKEHCNNC